MEPREYVYRCVCVCVSVLVNVVYTVGLVCLIMSAAGELEDTVATQAISLEFSPCELQ